MDIAGKSPATVAADDEAQAQNAFCIDNITSQFVSAMRAVEVAPSNGTPIFADGILHRFRVEGDKPGRRNGWYVLHSDGVPSGCFGSWKSGVTRRWCSKRKSQMTAAERRALRQRAATAAAKRAEIEAQRHKDASVRATKLLRQSHPADPAHPYLVAKRIRPHSARQRGDLLVLRIVDFKRRTLSVQFIGPGGRKRLLKGARKAGGFIVVAGRMPSASRILIAEGFATGATLAQAESDAFVLAAVDAGNLHAVAVGARRQWPTIEIVVCADADDVGRAKARAAAIAAGAKLAVPEFPSGAPGSDFNDLAALCAKEVQ